MQAASEPISSPRDDGATGQGPPGSHDRADASPDPFARARGTEQEAVTVTQNANLKAVTRQYASENDLGYREAQQIVSHRSLLLGHRQDGSTAILDWGAVRNIGIERRGPSDASAWYYLSAVSQIVKQGHHVYRLTEMLEVEEWRQGLRVSTTPYAEALESLQANQGAGNLAGGTTWLFIDDFRALGKGGPRDRVIDIALHGWKEGVGNHFRDCVRVVFGTDRRPSALPPAGATHLLHQHFAWITSGEEGLMNAAWRNGVEHGITPPALRRDSGPASAPKPIPFK